MKNPTFNSNTSPFKLAHYHHAACIQLNSFAREIRSRTTPTRTTIIVLAGSARTRSCSITTILCFIFVFQLFHPFCVLSFFYCDARSVLLDIAKVFESRTLPMSRQKGHRREYSQLHTTTEKKVRSSAYAEWEWHSELQGCALLSFPRK